MSNHSKIIQVPSGSELARLLEQATDTDLELENEGRRYRLTRLDDAPGESRITLVDEHDIWATYDPERVRRGLRTSTGVLHGVDRGRLLRDLREQREQDSNGRPA